MPSVSVVVAVLTIDTVRDHDRLAVLQVRSSAGWALPAGVVRRREGLVAAVLRTLRQTTGVEGVKPEQLCAFDDPAEDAVTVAHTDPITRGLLREALRRPDVRLADAASPGRVPPMHDQVVKQSVARLREQYAHSPDPAGLLPYEFTLSDLLATHQSVLGVALTRDTFRRAMADRLRSAGRLTDRGVGRPAELYRRAR